MLGPTAKLERWTGCLALAAGGIHGGLAPQHFGEWWGYGLFFLFAAAAQVLFGLALLTDAVNAWDTGADWRRWRRALYAAGIAGNLAIIAMYAVSRTLGIPFFGPEAGTVEPVAPVDVVSKALEVALIAFLAALLRGGHPLDDRPPARDPPLPS